MIIAKKRNGLIIFKYVVIGCIMIQLFSAFRVNAAESKVYELPISYFNQYSSIACDDNESIKKQTNIVLTATTDKLQKGTRLIISGIPKTRRGITTAGQDKINWVRRLLSEDIVVNIVYKEDKPQYCTGEDCILIDDLPANIQAWEKMGGTGIINTGAEDTRGILKEMGLL